MTVSKILEAVTTEICDNYCKYPDIYNKKYEDEEEALEIMVKEHCDDCPLNKLF